MSTSNTTVIAHVEPGQQFRTSPHSDDVSDADDGDHVGVEITGTGVVLVGRPETLLELARRIAAAPEVDRPGRRVRRSP